MTHLCQDQGLAAVDKDGSDSRVPQRCEELLLRNDDSLLQNRKVIGGLLR